MSKLKQFIKPIKIRSDQEEHRQATWIELFIDLAFVLGISQIGNVFSDGFTASSLINYGLLFLLFFWIWNRFTWYASMYDNDDIPYRICYLTLIFPVLGIASEIESILLGDFHNAIIYYLFINLLLLYLWSRVIRRANKLKKNAWFFFGGYAISTILISISLFTSVQFQIALLLFGFAFEFLGPVFGWYFSKSKIPIHSDHVIERHGLFTIILLGECIVAISLNFNAVFLTENWYVLFFSFIIVISLWWLYFDCGYGYKTKLSKNITKVFEFGYGQFFVYLAIALSGITLEYALHSTSGNHHLDGFLPGQILMCAVGFFIFALSAVQLLISNDKPLWVYLPRITFSLILIGCGLFPVFKENNHFIILTSILILLLTVNDVYQWAKYNLIHSNDIV